MTTDARPAAIFDRSAFFDAVRTGGPPPVPAAEATASLRTALAALESARTGRTVDLTTWELP